MSAVKYKGSMRCPVCHKQVSIKTNGEMYAHGPRKSCPGPTRYVAGEPMDSPEFAAKLRRLWRIGDALAASQLTGIPYPAPAIPEDLGADDYLAFVVADAREFIAGVAEQVGL